MPVPRESASSAGQGIEPGDASAFDNLFHPVSLEPLTTAFVVFEIEHVGIVVLVGGDELAIPVWL